MHHKAELAAAGVSIHIVAFWPLKSATEWRDQHPSLSEIPLLLDDCKSMPLYQAFGLGKLSKWNTWHPTTRFHYALHKAAGKKVYRARESDIEQGGGNFVVTKTGETLFYKRCATALDRPTVGEMLAAVHLFEKNSDK
eukprot:TRINITY_DN60919_c0_g1_i1.p2 TRINITY_DN60919_c0_g1~~TRINITY_DN60919_c0_g1_i1.p2  ORF type:complete len:138 (+),score=19.60 TRINITY_DN60919_c0_g1_i1:281-694(+)